MFLGLWPSFLNWNHQESTQQKTFDTNLLDFFLTAKHDGIHITWAHAVNNRDSLQQAVYGIQAYFIDLYLLRSKLRDCCKGLLLSIFVVNCYC